MSNQELLEQLRKVELALPADTEDAVLMKIFIVYDRAGVYNMITDDEMNAQGTVESFRKGASDAGATVIYQAINKGVDRPSVYWGYDQAMMPSQTITIEGFFERFAAYL